MKKLLFTLIACPITLLSSAQMTFDVGLMDQINTTWMLNQNVMDDGAAQDFAFSYANGFGLNATMYFAEQTGIEINIMSSKFKQNYEGSYYGLGYTSTTTLNSLDVPILFKFGKDAFFEIGTMISSYSGAEYKMKMGSFSDASSVKETFGSTNISGMIGMGGNIKLDDHFRIYMSLRLGYGFSDIEGVDGLGRDLGNKGDLTIYNELIYPEYKPTNTAFAGLALGFLYHIGD